MVTESESHLQQQQQQQTQSHQTDGNASFLRAARAGNLDKVLEYLKGSIDINTSNANGLNALHLASKEGHVSVVNELLKRGANVNAATKKGNTALHIASLAGQLEVVKVLIQNGANVNVQSLNGFSPLYMAAQENHDAVVKYLLSNGANQSLATEDGFTPLAVALQQGHDKVVAVLLENDTKGKVRLPALHVAAKKDDCKAAALLLQNDHNPDVTSKSGFTPLHIASHYGNENIAALLLDKNADVNFVAKHQITPLHVASKWGKVNMVSLLLDRKAKIDASTRDGLTPLHCAARSGHEPVVDLLLERGAPISAKTKNGLAPLHMAAQGDHVDSARILLFHKAPVDDITVDYLTALHVAAHCGHVRVAKLILDRKADPNSRALNGFTPLHIACKKNRIKVVELLLKHGASIESTTESGLTPLHVAAFMGCMNIVIYLIQHLANPDVPTVRGETPLHLAARANQIDIIRILLRNGAQVDAKAREQQTPLHIASRLGNVDIVGLLLQNGADIDATTKDMYTPLHIAAKEGQEEVATILLEQGASLTAKTKKGFTPLHLAAKYGNIKVARLLISKDAPVDEQGKNNVTPLHCAAHYDHVNVALLLLEKGASPHATAKNGYCPLHIAARKNQMDIATSLLEYGAKANAESKAGFTPLHLAAQEGHTDMATLLIGHQADVNIKAKNSLTPLHLCAQEDRVNVATILAKNGVEISPQTKAGYTPLHVASHFGQLNMVRFLLQNNADVNANNAHGYTPLHQAAQQGHTAIVNLLLDHKASPNAVTSQGQTALSIAQRLGYISVVETLKVVTETVVKTTTTTVTEEKYKVVAPETMHETFMSDSEDEAADDNMLGDQSYRYLTADEMKSLGDDSLPFDVTKDERVDSTKDLLAPITVDEELFSPHHMLMTESYVNALAPDNIDISRAPIQAGRLKWKTFLVSFMVDARGGAMRGCRHSGVRVIIPPRKAPMPMRITCRYIRKEKLIHPPPLMEGEACASRLLEMGPAGAKFLGPVIIEVPHFASLRGREREIIILRSDNGENWKEHALEASEEAVQEVLNESFEGENDVNQLDDFSSNRITRILTTDFPQYFAIITRIRQEVHAIGPEGGMVSSTVVPQVQAIFPEGALTKKIKVGLQAQPIPIDLVTKMLGNRVAVSPICTIEPRRRKFHKPITLTIPVPQAATRGMINQYTGDAPTLRLLCSITGGTTRAQWEDVTGSTPLTFVNDCVSFTTTVSARFWLIDCRQVNEATKFATELYMEAIHVPFMSKFVVFAKRHDPQEAQLRVFCMTDDKEDKTLENQEHFTEVAKSRDVEVLENKPQFLEFAGNLIPVTKSGEQLSLTFHAFRENRLPFVMRVKDPNQEPIGRIAFMRDNKRIRGSEVTQQPICNLNIELPDICREDSPHDFDKQYGLSTPDHKLSTGNGELLVTNGIDIIKDGLSHLRTTSGGDSLRREASLDVSYDEQDIMKEAESAEESGSEAGIAQRDRSFSAEKPRSRQTSTTSETDDHKARETAAEKFLELLEEQDRQDTSASDFFANEEMPIPSDGQTYDEPTEVRTTETTSILDDGSIKHTITAVTKTTVVQSQDVDDGANRQLLETETWHSEQDTSQVSVSSLPEDEKSEPSTTTVSSTTTTNTGDNIASALVTTSVEDEPHFDAIVEQKEWTEEDESGCVHHIIEQSSTIITDERDPKSKSIKNEESIIATNACDLQKQSHSQILLPTSFGLQTNNNSNDDSNQSVFPRPSPPEVVDVSDEQLSPVCDYSNYMNVDNQIKVGNSPTNDNEPDIRAYEAQQSNDNNDNNNSIESKRQFFEGLLTETTDSSYKSTDNYRNVSQNTNLSSEVTVSDDRTDETLKNRRKSSDDSDCDELKGVNVKRRVSEIEGKVKKQIVNEIFVKELNEEVVNGSPERKLIYNESKIKIISTEELKSTLDEQTYEEIRQEAQIIAETIVLKAKQEMSKISHNSNISSEISDEDLVEQEKDDWNDLNRVVNDSISPINETSSPISPDTAKAQKRISFTESDNYVRKGSIVLDKYMSPDELKRTLSYPRKSIDSGSRTSSAKERESTGSSSESHYQSFEVSDSSKTPSRPTSSEFDLTIIPEQRCHSSSRSSATGFGVSPSEYETCVTSQEGSYATAATSQDTSYHTAHTSLGSHESSRHSTISIESESSGHLAEISSEASETLVEEEEEEGKHSSLSDEEFDQIGNTTPVNDFKEPFDFEIPESVIRGGNEMPFMSGTNWKQMEESEEPIRSSTSMGPLNQLIDDKSTFRPPLMISNSIDESEQLSENSNTWHSSSIGTTINMAGQISPHSSLTNLGQSGSADSQRIHSISDSIVSLDNLNTNDNNCHIEANYNPDLDVSDVERQSIQSNATVVEYQSSMQDEKTSSSDMMSDTALISQSSFCSSVLSEHARHQLSYDLSPDLQLGSNDSPKPGSDDLQRPLSPLPPETEDKSPSEDCVNLTPDLIYGNEEPVELYTHQEVDEEIEESPTRSSLASRLSKPITIAANKSGESSAASSLKEFERYENEFKTKGSHHGSTDSLGSSLGSGKPGFTGRSSDRDDQSMSSSINEFEKFEKDCCESGSPAKLASQAQEDVNRLSEIEEGHESQASDASQETLSDGVNRDSDDTDSDYEKRMSEIDDMMRLAQNNVEKMQSLSKTSESISDDLKDDKPRPHSQNSSASAAQLILTRKVMSTESNDSHHKSSISTINTESLIDRIEDLDEIRCEYKDDNKSMSSDSLHDDFKDDSIHELEFQNENIMEKSMTESIQSHPSDSGPVLATLREEIDIEEDSLRDSFHGILKPTDCMISSTDSAATYATYQNESGMTSSVNSHLTSGDESTMSLSTDNPETIFQARTEAKTFADQSSDNQSKQFEDEYEEIQTVDQMGNVKIVRRIKRLLPKQQQTPCASSSSETEEKFLEKLRKSAAEDINDSEVIEEEKSFDEYGNIVIRRTVKQMTTRGPELTSKSVSGSSAPQQIQEFMEPFMKLQTTTDTDEYEGIEELGNAYKVIQEVTVTPEVRAVTFSGANAQQQMDQFVTNWSGDKNELIEINKQTFDSNSNNQQNNNNKISTTCEKQSTDFGRQNSSRSQGSESGATFTGNTRVLTETVSDSDGHTTVMETTIYHSEHDLSPLRESMNQIIDGFMGDEEANKQS